MRDIQYRDGERPEDLLHELGYETQDIHYKKISVYGAYFFGFLIVMAAAGYGILAVMSPTGLRGGQMIDYVPKTDMPAATPMLQSNITARTDIMSLRRKETDVLYSAGVVDQNKGVYRIPIDQAIDEISKRGLPKTTPVRSNGQVPVTLPQTTLPQSNGPSPTFVDGHVKLQKNAVIGINLGSSPPTGSPTSPTTGGNGG